MDEQSFSYVRGLMQIVLGPGNTRANVEKFFIELRQRFVFDNVAVYLQDDETRALEIEFARAVGRAKTAEADAAWGEIFATQVLARQAVIIQEPATSASKDDRLRQAYLLGAPLRSDGLIAGALVFVRFGGPAYEQDHKDMAAFVADSISLLFERQEWKRIRDELNEIKLLMQLQDDFVSTISHELRTPLGFIKGYSTSLLREDTSWDAATQKEFLTIIDEEADRLSQLIENVLESARLQSKTLPLRFQPMRLDAVIRDVATRLRSRFKDLEINMDLRTTNTIHADGVRMAQVLDNLFTNAIKYAPGSAVDVTLQQIDTKLLMSFSDHGPGVPLESLQMLFERFYRVRGEKATGTGLGLFICKQIIEAHRGKIWAESTPGQGTTFFIELPINSA